MSSALESNRGHGTKPGQFGHSRTALDGADADERAAQLDAAPAPTVYGTSASLDWSQIEAFYELTSTDPSVYSVISGYDEDLDRICDTRYVADPRTDEVLGAVHLETYDWADDHMPSDVADTAVGLSITIVVASHARGRRLSGPLLERACSDVVDDLDALIAGNNEPATAVVMFAEVADGNEASQCLFEAHGFEQCADFGGAYLYRRTDRPGDQT